MDTVDGQPEIVGQRIGCIDDVVTGPDLDWVRSFGRSTRAGSQAILPQTVRRLPPLLASEHAARIADAIEKVATSIDELAAQRKTIEAPDPD